MEEGEVWTDEWADPSMVIGCWLCGEGEEFPLVGGSEASFKI